MIEQQVANLVRLEIANATLTGVNPESIGSEATLSGDLGLDSLDRIEIAMEIETRLGLEDESMEALNDCETVSDVVTRAWNLLSEGGEV